MPPPIAQTALTVPIVPRHPVLRPSQFVTLGSSASVAQAGPEHPTDHLHHDTPQVGKRTGRIWTTTGHKTGETVTTHLELTARTPVYFEAASKR